MALRLALRLRQRVPPLAANVPWSASIDERQQRGGAQLCSCDTLHAQAALITPPPTLATLLPARRAFHASASNESATFVMGCVGVAGACLTIDYGIKEFNAWQERRAAEPDAQDGDAASDGEGGKEEASSGFGFGSTFYAKRFYDGPFEDKMTRREAALILGVRESASAKRIKNAHRKLLILNHPDTGGSTFLATKLNEAKELLLKTATDDD